MSELREGAGVSLSSALGDERSPARRIVVGHPVRLVADSLKALFRALAPDLQVTQATSVREVLTALQAARHDLLIWSTLQFQNEAIAIIPQFRQIQDDLRILLLVESYDRELIDRAVALGIRGAITSTTPGEMAIGVARLLLQGGTFVPTAGGDNVAAAPDSWVTGGLPDIGVPPRKPLPNEAMRQYELTPRQWEVLGLLGIGKSNKAIAKDLGMQETTVKAHIKQIMKKLNVENRTQAALFAVRHGAVDNRAGIIS